MHLLSGQTDLSAFQKMPIFPKLDRAEFEALLQNPIFDKSLIFPAAFVFTGHIGKE